MFRKLLSVIFPLVLLLSGTAYAVIPGWHRSLTPQFFGLHQVTHRIYTDDLRKSKMIKNFIKNAEATSFAFFGDAKATPTYVVCTRIACREKFDLRPGGLTIGYHRVLIAPNGFNQTIFTHERVHVDLHRRMDLSDVIFGQRFPAWFNEGLASHLSGDKRNKKFSNPRQAEWIKSARSYRDWTMLNRKRSWHETYGAAQTLVRKIDAKIGRKGMRELIAQVSEGADFASTLSRLMAK